MPNNKSITQFSPHLFWDVEQHKINWEKNTPFLVGRVLEYGKLEDWLLLKHELGVEKIANFAKKLRNLDDVSINFIAMIAGIPKEEFRCYTTKRLRNKHWDC